MLSRYNRRTVSKIARFEAVAERLVEGTFARLFVGHLRPLEVATSLLRAMEDSHADSANGLAQAPTHYWVYLHQEDHKALEKEQPDLEEELARHVSELADQAGFALRIAPTIRVLASDEVEVHRVQIRAEWSPDAAVELETTREIELGQMGASISGPSARPGRPFLIVDGRRHISLLQAVVSVGRAVDNDVIIENPRVSRHHAQLRLRYGRYVLYDLGGPGGTQINSYPVEECVLHSGDVVSFGGVEVIYGEDPAGPVPPRADGDTPTASADV